MLADTQYKQAKKDADFLVPLIPNSSYSPSEKEAKTITNVMTRFTDMKSARTRIDIDWQTWQRIIESKFYPYSDGRTRVNVPLFRAIQEIFVSEATSRRIDKEIKPVGMSDVDKVEVMKEVWEYEWNKNRRDEAMTEAEYKCSGMGTCAYFT